MAAAASRAVGRLGRFTPIKRLKIKLSFPAPHFHSLTNNDDEAPARPGLDAERPAGVKGIMGHEGVRHGR